MSEMIKVRLKRACKLKLERMNEPAVYDDEFEVTPKEFEVIAEYVDVIAQAPAAAEEE